MYISIFPQDGVDMYTCDCHSGYTGPHCEEDIDECKMYPDMCKNGATCEVSLYTVYTHTENDVTILLAISAQNNAGSYTCQCSEYYTGNLCDEDIMECKDMEFCQNQGTCTVSS